MIPPLSLGALANVQQMLVQLVEDLPVRECKRVYQPDLPSMGWLLGRSVYLELHLLREVVADDPDLARRVRRLFAHDVTWSPELDERLPPREHLLSWAREVHDTHLTMLANPGQLPRHPLLKDGWLVGYLAQRHAATYERMLAVRTARTLAAIDPAYQPQEAPEPRRPTADGTRVDQGHYRVGARDGVVMDCEQPAQMVELHSFRICRRPVSNAEYLAFIADGGYTRADYWDKEGAAWLRHNGARQPWNWLRNDAGAWFAAGLNGPADLAPDEPVSGIGAHEARAFAAWAASQCPGMEGAVLPHEYQWEVAARLGGIEGYGRSWEWCANRFHPYAAAAPEPASVELRSSGLDGSHGVRRGGCLHTLPAIRRASYRDHAPDGRRNAFAGLRLVLPPGKAAWE